jgi:hypothetical protein
LKIVLHSRSPWRGDLAAGLSEPPGFQAGGKVTPPGAEFCPQGELSAWIQRSMYNNYPSGYRTRVKKTQPVIRPVPSHQIKKPVISFVSKRYDYISNMAHPLLLSIARVTGYQQYKDTHKQKPS